MQAPALCSSPPCPKEQLTMGSSERPPPFVRLHSTDPDEDVIGAEGIMKLCEDLGIEPADIVMVSAMSSTAQGT
eukprot:scaffold137605_cov17-Tisochrysis_lutea.AAC.2